eukprot:snap_masked-scaffold_1-processed-gene-21.46-mRNA-1 protein AED:1.00 eAED:1.00 QI:0/-1/0/0/-1/1/1/0/283
MLPKQLVLITLLFSASLSEEVCTSETCSGGDSFQFTLSLVNSPEILLSRGSLILTETESKSKKLLFTKKSFELSSKDLFFKSLLSDVVNDGEIKYTLSDSTKDLVFTTSACKLAAANFQEIFKFNLFKTEQEVEILSFDVKPQINPMVEENCEDLEYRKQLAETVKSKTEITFKTKSRASFPKVDFKDADFSEPESVKGASVSEADEQFDLKKKKKPNVDGEEDEEENQGFLRKYWYIFVPMLIMNLVSSISQAANQQEGQEQVQGAPNAAATKSKSRKRGKK